MPRSTAPTRGPSSRRSPGTTPSPRPASTAASSHDLDVVCLKCLSKDPCDRYESVAALACRTWTEVRSWRGLPNGGGRACQQFSFDAAHTRYVHADSDGNVFLREVAGEQELGRLAGFKPQPEVRLSPDAAHLTVWEESSQHVGKSRVFALEWDAPRLVFVHPVPTTPWIAFTPDGRRVAFPTADRTTVCVRDLTTGESREWKPEIPVEGRLSFSPDGRQLAVPMFDKGNGAIHFCDPDTGAVAARLNLNWSGRMRMVEVTSGREVLTFPCVGVTSDWAAGGRHLGTAADKHDDRLRILRYDPGRELRAVRPMFGGGYAGVADGQQRWVVAGGPDNLVAVGVTEPSRDNGHRGVAIIDRRTGRAVAEIALPDTVVHISPAGHLFTDGPNGLLEWPRAGPTGGVRFGPPQVRLPPYRGGGYARRTGTR